MAHILLVDDEEAITYVFKRYLERAGHQVTAAVDPVDALTIGLAGGIDLLVTDFRMPGMTGASLIGRLREHTPQLPALIVTAYGAEVGVTAADIRVLNKPLPPQDLVDAVASALRPDGAS
ncbi:response regulator [Massilia sp. IC2-477]|uniref:response regulator n=1 Tax=Massilia sp. IC2-477 TaxID=2887198 RepID=UPI001D0FB561|nr:response regulator [Massilia sp. IC2-477]MCC2957461.1 response regulator [Massilia sp. IC2-477]